MTKKELRNWNRIDIDFIAKIFAMSVALVGIIIALYFAVTLGYEKICYITMQKNNAKQINAEIDKLYAMADDIGIILIRDIDLKNKKSMYDPITEAMQREVIEQAHTKIAEKKVPYGTWVKLTSTGQPLKVIGHIGLECITKEGVMFMSTEEDEYEFISEWQYDTLKQWRWN